MQILSPVCWGFFSKGRLSIGSQGQTFTFESSYGRMNKWMKKWECTQCWFGDVARQGNTSVQFQRQFEWFLGSSHYVVQKSHIFIWTSEASLSFWGQLKHFCNIDHIYMQFSLFTSSDILRWFLKIALMVLQACLRLFSCMFRRKYSSKEVITHEPNVTSYKWS